MPRAVACSRLGVVALLFACAATIIAADGDPSIPKALDPDDSNLPIHRPVKANDLVQQIYEYQHCRDKLPKLNLQESSLHDQLLDRLDIASNAVDQLEEAKSLGQGYSHAYLKWMKLSDEYKQALHSATSLQDAAKDAAGQLRQQQDAFASHKHTIQHRIKKLREAQLQLAAWRYALKLVLYKHAGLKRVPPIITGSSSSSSSNIKMFSLRSLRESMAITSQALSRVAKDTPGLAALINTQTDITDILDPRIPYDTSSRRHILSLSRGDDHHASSSLAAALQRELNQLKRRSERRAGGS